MIPAIRTEGKPQTVLDTYEAGLWVAATWGDNATERRWSRLLPKPVLRDIIAECERAVAQIKPAPNATYLEATRAAQILVGSYPNVKPHDPEIYLKGLASVFHEFSADTIMRAVDMLTRTKKYLPARSEVLEACRASAETPGAKLWASIYLAERQLAEHAERERDAQIAAQTPEQRKAIADAIMGRAGYREPPESERESRAVAFESAAKE